MALFTRLDTRAALASLDGDDAYGQLTANGDLRVRDDDAIVILGTMDADLGTIDADTGNLVKSICGAAAPTAAALTTAVVDCATGTTTEVIATPGSGKQLWIYGLLGLANTVDLTIVLKSATTALTGTMTMADNGGFCMDPSGNFSMPWFKCATNQAFNITTGTGTFDGIVSYAVITV